MTIWFASGNLNKKAELAAILRNNGVTCSLLIPQDAGLEFNPDETETSFHGNALLKAKELYRVLNKPHAARSNVNTADPHHSRYQPGDMIIADDSGICVDALDGRPGIHSARYAGRNVSYDSMQNPIGGAVDGKKLQAHERNILLLEELGTTTRRTARFVCAMVLLFSLDRFYFAQETCEGEIVRSIEQAKGAGGFGYDPILFIPELNRTVAELSEEEKNTISHRAKAGKVIARLLCQN
ncbi:MAG: non-canonical purine NTP pyrophosphatase [Treponema sp.]|nr:non-canonical purine NTP pyrophosphatase [Treponema sp.]